ncbi:MAG: TonB-dependent receptor, partial [Mucilaginibacter polytrichastri]|nr:TonB-dependent receptor [Mucilaginibacter polytrichastri]
GVVRTQRADYRQFDAIIRDLNYQLPTTDPFKRIIDHDTPWKSDNDIGGASLNIESKIGPGTLTSTTAWRYWDWNPSNDRDFTGLQSLALSQNPSKHRQWSQEVRYAGEFSDKLSGVLGLFFIGQDIKTTGSEVAGNVQWRFAQSSTSELWKTPGLFEGYGIYTNSSIKSQSAAIFANADWEALKSFHVQPGLRFNYDNKDVNYDRKARGGQEFTDPAIIALRKSVYSDQAYTAQADENNFTYNLTLSYRPDRKLNIYATHSTSYKPVGVNVAGLPTTTVNGETVPDLSLSVIKPEHVRHYEAGVKSTPARNFTVNFTVFNTDIKNYQANVQSPQLGVNRGYIANADRVRVRGAELDLRYNTPDNHFNFTGALGYSEGKYVKFTNAPLPLEETGASVSFKDISGERLPGISKWSGSLNGEYTTPSKFFRQDGSFFLAANTFFRSEFSSSPSPSAYLNIGGYALLNGRVGFRATQGISFYVWGRNLLNHDYFEQLLPAGGNAGQYAAVLGDPRTYGATIRYSF